MGCAQSIRAIECYVFRDKYLAGYLRSGAGGVFDPLDFGLCWDDGRFFANF
jgi:hypothetical protein